MASSRSEREHFFFSSNAVSDENGFHVLRLVGTEAMSRPYEFTIHLATQLSSVRIMALLSAPATLTMHLPGTEPARFSGYPQDVDVLSNYNGWTFLRLVLKPGFSRLAHVVQNRIYVDCNVKEILQDALECLDSMDIDVDYRLHGTYEKQEFSMQRNESILQYVSWKMERDGIYYYFDEQEKGERIIFADSMLVHGRGTVGKLTFSPTSGLNGVHSQEVAVTFAEHASIMPARVVLRDYDWTKPGQSLEASANVSPYGVGDAYYYGEGFTTTAEGKRLAEIRAQSIRCHSRVFRGTSAAPGIRPGFNLEIERHWDKDLNRGYTVTAVRHEASQEAFLSQAIGVPIDNPDRLYYRNEFTCIPDDVQFRPERTAVRQKVSGMINAFTASSSDSPIPEIDEHGRYKVVFPQDVAGRAQGKSSCWIRRLREHVGLHHGTTMPLAPGVEVLVTFLDGDPDRPVIAGALSNPQTGSVESAASAQTSGFRTAGGGGLTFNNTSEKQSLNLTSGGRSGLFMGSGSLDSATMVTDSCVNSATTLSSSFSGLGSSIASLFSASLSTGPTDFNPVMALDLVNGILSSVNAAVNPKLYTDNKGYQQIQETAVTGVKAILSSVQAIIGFKQKASLIKPVWPYAASLTGTENRSSVSLQSRMSTKNLGIYLGFSIAHLVAYEAQEAMSACMNARTEDLKKQEAIVKEWAAAQYKAQQTQGMSETDAFLYTNTKEYQDGLDAYLKQQMSRSKGAFGGFDNFDEANKWYDQKHKGDDDYAPYGALQSANWQAAGRKMGTAGAKLVPEITAMILIYKKAHVANSRLGLTGRPGGVMIKSPDSNVTVVGEKETRITGGQIYLGADPGAIIYAVNKDGSELAKIQEKFPKLGTSGFCKGVNDILLHGDNLKGFILGEHSESADEFHINGRAIVEITNKPSVTSKFFDVAHAIASPLAECPEELACINRASKYETVPTAYAATTTYTSFAFDSKTCTLEHNGEGLKLDMTASKKEANLEIKRTRAGGSSSEFDFKEDKALLQYSKGKQVSHARLQETEASLMYKDSNGVTSSVLLASSKAMLKSKDTFLKLDGGEDKVALKAKKEIKLNTGSCSITGDSKILLTSGRHSLSVESSGIKMEGKMVTIEGSMIKIG